MGDHHHRPRCKIQSSFFWPVFIFPITNRYFCIPLLCVKNVSFRSSGSTHHCCHLQPHLKKGGWPLFIFIGCHKILKSNILQHQRQFDQHHDHLSWTEPRYSCLKVVRFVLCDDSELDDDDGRSMQSRTPGCAIRDFYKFNFLGNLRQRTTTNRLGNFTD